MIKNQKKSKVVIAMSGGVDSSVAAALLKQQGFDVIGVFMQFWFPAGEKYGENRCCSLESYQQAREVARILNIPIHKVNFGRQFKKLIVDEFLSAYKNGKTPNPCVACNKFIKFDLLLKYAKEVFGADYLATGHYIRLLSSPRRRGSRVVDLDPGSPPGMTLKILKAKDQNKDQSYFLYNLDQPKLKHLLFPLGDYQKEKVRQLAKKFNLPVHDKKDSQEICFVGESHYDFLKKYLKLKPGKIITYNFPLLTKEGVGGGFLLGQHEGLPLYTMGQRTGIGLSGGPWYVAGFDYKKNLLVVTKNQKQSTIFKKELKCQKINWLADSPKLPLACEAQIRYHAKPAKCHIYRISPPSQGGDKEGVKLPLPNPPLVKGRGYFRIIFKTPQRAVMPGQSVVFYAKDELLGGGVITN